MNIRELHNKAMELADQADNFKAKKDSESAYKHYHEAFQIEKEAALTSFKEQKGEPTISVLLRSAASLAIDCKEFREAEKLIGLALSGEPPMDIAEELRDLLEMVNFNRHLDLKGVTLQDNELQLVIAGNGIGPGLGHSQEILGRITNFERLTVRTIERKTGKPFRQQGGVSKELKKYCQSFISTPRVASMAFTIKFASSIDENTLPGFSNVEEIIDDITDNIELINSGNLLALKDRIPDEAYLNSFIALTKELAPDGDAVNLFGITSVKRGVEKRTMLTKNKEKLSQEIELSFIDNTSETAENEDSISSISGILKAADASKNAVRIEFPENKPNLILKVPDGLYDIVRNYWDENVTVKYRSGKKNTLIDICNSK